MGKIKLINVVIALENLLCIYRNYSCLSGFCQRVALIRVATIYVLYIFVCFDIVISTCSFSQQVVFCYLIVAHTILTSLITLMTVSSGIGYTNTFKKFTTKLDSVHEYCSLKVSYRTSMKNLVIAVCVCFALFVLSYLIILVILLLSMYRWFRENDGTYSFTDLIRSMVSYWREFRFHCELFIFNILIKIMTILLNQLKLNLMAILESLNDSDEGVDDITCYNIKKELTIWISAYNCLALCCEELKKCYGAQVLVSLFILMLYLIVISYHCVEVATSKNSENIEKVQPILALLMHFLAATVVLLYNGQDAQNKANCLKELITKFHNKLLGIPGPNVLELRRSIKNFRRQMAVQPVKIKLLSTTPLQMSVLLLILSNAVSYTIILLQFTHVV